MLHIRESTYFEALREPFAFDVDLARLEQTYKKLMRTMHPDVAATRSAASAADAAEASAFLNSAFDTLRNPSKRAMYMLELVGCPLEEGTESASELIRADFLAEVLDLRELIENLEGDAGDESTIAQLETRLEELSAACYEDLRVAFAALESTRTQEQGALTPNAAAAERARAATARLQYLQRIRDTLQQQRRV